MVSQFKHAPRTSHLHVVKRIYKYLQGIADHGLLFRSNSRPDLMVAFCDSDQAGCPDNSRSNPLLNLLFSQVPTSFLAFQETAYDVPLLHKLNTVLQPTRPPKSSGFNCFWLIWEYSYKFSFVFSVITSLLCILLQILFYIIVVSISRQTITLFMKWSLSEIFKSNSSPLSLRSLTSSPRD